MSNNKYVSSIVSNYGYPEKVSKDVLILKEIISRQGISLLIDAIAESCGETAVKFNLKEADRENLIRNTANELRNSLSERL